MSDKILPESEIAAAREIFEMVEMPKQGNRILDSHEALRGKVKRLNVLLGELEKHANEM